MKENRYKIAEKDEEEDVYKRHLKKMALKDACFQTGCCVIPALLLIGYFCFPLIVFLTGGHWLFWLGFFIFLCFFIRYYCVLHRKD